MTFNGDSVCKEYDSFKSNINTHLNQIETLIKSSGAPCFEGNSFYYHDTFTLFDKLYTKQVNLFWMGKQATKICEIGFNAGHSAMLMLLGRDKNPIDFTVFDIGHHLYTRPTYEYIKNVFPHINFEYIEGDSTVTLPNWINVHKEQLGQYDLVHVDGGHYESCVSSDLKYADLLLKIGGLVIVDDSNSNLIERYINYYLNSGRYTEVNLLKTAGYEHRVLRKLA